MQLLDIFRDWKDVVEFPAKTVLFTERDSADVMYVVLTGEVELTLRGEPLGAESAGGIFGEMAMINTGRRNATATTLTHVKLARLDQEQFRKIVGENTEFSLHVMAVLANRLRAVDHYISTQFG